MAIPHLDLPVDSFDVAGRFSVERMSDGYEAAYRRCSRRRSRPLIGRWRNQLLWPCCHPAWA